MPRQAIKNDVPEEWRRRLKAGLCPVCAKSPPEFDKGQMIYCSAKCRDEYASKYTWWSEIRQKILERDNKTCQECGLSQSSYDEQMERMKVGVLEKWISQNKDYIEKIRDEQLVILSRKFKEDFDEIMDDKLFVEKVVRWKLEKEIYESLPETKWVHLEVDHKVAVALGGDMWDENNMRTLCEDCHKKKTKIDIAKIKAQKMGVESLNV